MDGSDFFTSCACLSPSATTFTVRRHQHTTYKQSISTVNLFFSFFFLLACFRFLFFIYFTTSYLEFCFSRFHVLFLFLYVNNVTTFRISKKKKGSIITQMNPSLVFASFPIGYFFRSHFRARFFRWRFFVFFFLCKCFLSLTHLEDN